MKDVEAEGAILVVGASGTVGSKVADMLVQNGEAVRAATRDPGGQPGRAGMHWALFDFERPETFEPALAGVSRAFLIARPGDEHSDRLSLPFIDAMKRAGVVHAVNLTAMGAELAGHVPALRNIEQHLEDSGIAFTHLRPNFFMQFFTSGSLLAALTATGTLKLPAGEAAVSFIDAADIAEVATAALSDTRHRGRAYTLTGDRALTHHEVCRLLSGASGRELRYRAIDDDEMERALKAMGAGAAQIARLLRFYRLVREGRCSPVSSAVRDVLGRPATSFSEFARRNAALFR